MTPLLREIIGSCLNVQSRSRPKMGKVRDALKLAITQIQPFTNDEGCFREDSKQAVQTSNVPNEAEAVLN